MTFQQQFLQSRAPGIIPGMASSESDPSLKSQPSGRVIEQGLTRSLRMETPGFDPTLVRANNYTRDGRCLSPQISFFPIRGGRDWFEKYHASVEVVRKLSQ